MSDVTTPVAPDLTAPVAPVETLVSDVTAVTDDVAKAYADSLRTVHYGLANMGETLAGILTVLATHMQVYHAGDAIVADLLALRAKL